MPSDQLGQQATLPPSERRLSPHVPLLLQLLLHHRQLSLKHRACQTRGRCREAEMHLEALRSTQRWCIALGVLLYLLAQCF